MSPGAAADALEAGNAFTHVDLVETSRTRRRYDRIAWLYDACEWPMEQLVHRRLRQKLFWENATRCFKRT